MRLLLFAGTGGAGTTTVAAATAVHAARRGVKTLLLAPEPGAGPAGPAALLGPDAASAGTDAPAEVERGLFAQCVDPPARARRAWHAVREPLTTLVAALGVDPVEAPEFTCPPGLDDVLTLLEIRDAAAAGWDLVVVDTPALARTLGLLALAEALPLSVERILPIERRMLWAMGHGASPVGAPAPPRGVVEVAERLHAELVGVREVLVAPGASVRLVLAPQPAPLAQAWQAWTALALAGLAVDGVVVNRLVPGDRADPWRRARAAAEAAVLADAEASFAPLTVRPLAERAVAPARRADLVELAAELYGNALPHADTPSGPVRHLVVERSGDDFVLVLPLPLVDRTELDLHRRADELIVDVAGRRRVLTVPGALRRCQVVAAALREGELRVTFRPDPALWRPL